MKKNKKTNKEATKINEQRNINNNTVKMKMKHHNNTKKEETK